MTSPCVKVSRKAKSEKLDGGGELDMVLRKIEGSRARVEAEVLSGAAAAFTAAAASPSHTLLFIKFHSTCSCVLPHAENKQALNCPMVHAAIGETDGPRLGVNDGCRAGCSAHAHLLEPFFWLSLRTFSLTSLTLITIKLPRQGRIMATSAETAATAGLRKRATAADIAPSSTPTPADMKRTLSSEERKEPKVLGRTADGTGE